jgi:S1-C subfamily serine protease
VDFWTIGERLARAEHIQPLATRGIVGQVSRSAVVYDAETTHGGSGGPVLNLMGQVIAVNAAILKEFSGSNIGVPVGRASSLIGMIDKNE